MLSARTGEAESLHPAPAALPGAVQVARGMGAELRNPLLWAVIPAHQAAGQAFPL